MAEMRGLYKVYVVDPRGSGTVIMDGKLVIAVTESEAILKAGVAQIATDKKLELEQVDIYAEHISNFIRSRKETQRVKMVKDEED